MSSPKTKIVQIELQNEHASMPLIVPVAVICNTTDDELHRNIRENAALDLEWVEASPAHNGIAVLCGGGASIEDHLDDISSLQNKGATIFAMNAASKYLRGHGIPVDYQVIADAKEETSQLVDPIARDHLFASQVNAKTLSKVKSPKLWHLEIGEIESLFPPDKVEQGGYALICGGSAVGDCAACLVYAMGYRELHFFGYDSCHTGKRSHAYEQPMNAFFPVTDVEWAGKTYRASVAMKAQAERFQMTAAALKGDGCKLNVYGYGLLQAMYATPTDELSERDKYRLIWQFDGYREVAPGEHCVSKAIEFYDSPGPVIDFGCGTGRSSLRLKESGFDVILVDFADNCRDEEALDLTFLEWDLTEPCPLKAPFGFCTDMMEHVPTDDVETVIRNIMASAQKVFFQISTVPDTFGAVIGQKLHNTVKPHEWWAAVFAGLEYSIEWQEKTEINSCFVVSA